MKLLAYIKREGLSFAEFGRRCDPEIPRVSIRQYALEERFPKTRDIIKNICRASNNEVTANDFVNDESEAA